MKKKNSASSRERLSLPLHSNFGSHHWSVLKGKSVELLWVLSDHLTTNHCRLVHIHSADITTDGNVCNKQLLTFMEKFLIHHSPTVMIAWFYFFSFYKKWTPYCRFGLNALNSMDMILLTLCLNPTLKWCLPSRHPSRALFSSQKRVSY